MNSLETIDDLKSKLDAAVAEAQDFFRACAAEREAAQTVEISEGLAAEGKRLAVALAPILVRTMTLVRASGMFGDADTKRLQVALRRTQPALRLRLYEEWGPQVMSDEDRVLGVTPAGSSETHRLNPDEAWTELSEALGEFDSRLLVLRAEAEVGDDAGTALPAPMAACAISVKPRTAFIMMMIDPAKPELEDVKQTFQEEFARVGVKALRADDIEHSGEITHRILDEIKSSEFLVADLTGERPSVYYEVGFAHAVGKRPMLYRRAGTNLHFDLKVHNCSEYTNLTDLREKLRRRLAVVVRGEET